jgi:hypothetical protein
MLLLLCSSFLDLVQSIGYEARRPTLSEVNLEVKGRINPGSRREAAGAHRLLLVRTNGRDVIRHLAFSPQRRAGVSPTTSAGLFASRIPTYRAKDMLRSARLFLSV